MLSTELKMIQFGKKKNEEETEDTEEPIGNEFETDSKAEDDE